MEKVKELSKHQLKPDPTVLREICQNEGVREFDAAYVGDSIAKDILMAKRAGVFGIWAKYGSILDSDAYEKLVRVSHWTDEDVYKERRYSKEAKLIQPDFIATESFQEILVPIIS